MYSGRANAPERAKRRDIGAEHEADDDATERRITSGNIKAAKRSSTNL